MERLELPPVRKIIPLSKVFHDPRARDGTWCTLPYPLHKKGCPNFPKCPNNRVDFLSFNDIQWWAVVESFDLRNHAIHYLKTKKWCKTMRQARCVLYWQPKLRSKHLKTAEEFMKKIGGTIILTIPEANGVNVFRTMAYHGLYLKANPDMVYKIMLVGKQI